MLRVVHDITKQNCYAKKTTTANVQHGFYKGTTVISRLRFTIWCNDFSQGKPWVYQGSTGLVRGNTVVLLSRLTTQRSGYAQGQTGIYQCSTRLLMSTTAVLQTMPTRQKGHISTISVPYESESGRNSQRKCVVSRRLPYSKVSSGGYHVNIMWCKCRNGYCGVQ